MGGIVKGLFGGNDDGRHAAAAANAGVDRSIEELTRQFNETSQTFQPFIDAGIQGFGGQQQSSTLGGFGQRLNEIFNNGSLDGLIDERTRAARGQLAAGGLTRSGTAVDAIAGIPQELAFALEQLLTGRQEGIADIGFTATQNVGQLGANKSSGVAGGLTQKGQNISSGILADAQADAAAFGNLTSLASSFAFSDPRLKTNVVQVSSIGDLGVYQWDWIDAAKDTSIATEPTVGFMADEVEEKYPMFAGEFLTWKGVFYTPLLDHLKQKFTIPEHA